MMTEYVPEGMVLPHGDPEIDADDTSRMRLPKIARAKEEAAIGHQPGGLAAYLEAHGGLAASVETKEAPAASHEAAGDSSETSAPDASDEDLVMLSLDELEDVAARPSVNIRFPDCFDIPYEQGDDFDIHLK